MKSTILSTGILTAGLLFAQALPASAATPPANGAPNSPAGHYKNSEDWQNRIVQRLNERLSLTADQQSKVRSILSDSRAMNQGLSSEYREERMALDDAVRTNAKPQIDRIVRENATLNTQMTVNHLKTMASIYAVLTPDQKATFDHLREGWTGVIPNVGD